jgi:hypothetical protein
VFQFVSKHEPIVGKDLPIFALFQKELARATAAQVLKKPFWISLPKLGFGLISFFE